MGRSSDEHELVLRIVHRMVMKRVVGRKHHQPQTIAGWFAIHERGDVKQTIDEMVTDPEVPLRQKGRGTVQLIGIPEAQQFLEDHGEESPNRW